MKNDSLAARQALAEAEIVTLRESAFAEGLRQGRAEAAAESVRSSAANESLMTALCEGWANVIASDNGGDTEISLPKKDREAIASAASQVSTSSYRAIQSIDKILALTRKSIATKASRLFTAAEQRGSSEGTVRAEQIVKSLPEMLRRAVRAYSRGDLVWTTTDGSGEIISAYEDKALVALASDIRKSGLDSIFELLEGTGGLQAIGMQQRLGPYGHP